MVVGTMMEVNELEEDILEEEEEKEETILCNHCMGVLWWE